MGLALGLPSQPPIFPTPVRSPIIVHDALEVDTYMTVTPPPPSPLLRNAHSVIGVAHGQGMAQPMKADGTPHPIDINYFDPYAGVAIADALAVA